MEINIITCIFMFEKSINYIILVEIEVLFTVERFNLNITKYNFLSFNIFNL